MFVVTLSLSVPNGGMLIKISKIAAQWQCHEVP
jgi:hypothetical protein